MIGTTLQLKKECVKCRSWTKEKNHDIYRCYDENCPAKQRKDEQEDSHGNV